MALRILSATQVDETLGSYSIDELLRETAKLFRMLHNNTSPGVGSGGVQAPHRNSVQTMNQKGGEYTYTYTMLSMLADVRGYGCANKIIAVPQKDKEKGGPGGGLPASTIVLNESGDGRASVVMNSRALSAVRTALGELFTCLVFETWDLRL